jgi:two-component system CheB/CheR fusion protein
MASKHEADKSQAATPQVPTQTETPVIRLTERTGELPKLQASIPLTSAVDVLNKFGTDLPPGSGAAVMFLLPPDPVLARLLAESIKLHTSMKVVTAHAETVVEPNVVYLLPVNEGLTLTGNPLRQMEQELHDTREELQQTHLQLAQSHEELQSFNEEILSMNEELRLANEEQLEANRQLREKVRELEAVRNDMANLLNCTDIATVFLDTQFRIRRFTPRAIRLMRLRATDVGRSLDNLAFWFTDEQLLADAALVLQDQKPRERQIQTDDKRWWVRRIVPYRTINGRVEGVVLTFSDVTDLKRGEEALLRTNEWLERQVAERTAELQERSERLRVILDTAFSAIVSVDSAGIIQSANQATASLFGYPLAQLLGMSLGTLKPALAPGSGIQAVAEILPTLLGSVREVTCRRSDGTDFPALMAASAIPQLGLYTFIFLDITRQKDLEREVVEIGDQHQREIGQNLHDTVGQELTALSMLTRELTETLSTPSPQAGPLLEQLRQGLQRSQRELRAIMRGLLPVGVDGEGLMAALGDLALRAMQDAKLSCSFECPEPVQVPDNATATHLFLIAQEAVHNAVKHAQAGRICIRLTKGQKGVELSVQDDGRGLRTLSAQSPGLGLRIMRNRSAILRATLDLKPATPHGTIVTCTLPLADGLSPRI